MIKIFLALFLLPLLAIGQISVTSPVAGLASTTNGTTYSLGAFTPTANSLLVVMIVGSETVAASPTVSGGSLTWVESAATTVGLNRYYIYYAKVGISPVSTTITFDCTGDAATGALMSVSQFTGYNRDKANPIKQTFISTATTTSTNANITFSNALDPANGYMIGWSCTANVSSVPPTDWTEQVDMTFNSPRTTLSTASRNGGLSTAGPITFTNNSSTWIVMGVEVFVFNRGLPANFF